MGYNSSNTSVHNKEDMMMSDNEKNKALNEEEFKQASAYFILTLLSCE